MWISLWMGNVDVDMDLSADMDLTVVRIWIIWIAMRIWMPLSMSIHYPLENIHPT